MISVIDYGASNLKSVLNACNYLGKPVELITEPEDLEKADKIILPGVGNFGDAMTQLEKFDSILSEKIADNTPFLGICLGIQLIFEKSDEAPTQKGFGFLKGNCLRFPNSVKVPHMGWNDIRIENDSPLLKGVESGSYVYFVHSYYSEPANKKVIVSTTSYGVDFPSIVSKDNLFAVQFHPEKSGETGLKILRNFLDL